MGDIRNDIAYLEEVINRKNERIDQLEAERRWIPVGESLPEKDVHVLVVVNFDNKDYVDIDKFDGCMWVNYPSFQVSHWMPLPSPPEDK